MDIYPSVLAQAGIPRPQGVHAVGGDVITPLIEQTAPAWSRPGVLVTHKVGNHALVTNTTRYIRYEDGSQELYDAQADPFDVANKATDSAAKQEIDRMNSLLEQRLTK